MADARQLFPDFDITRSWAESATADLSSVHDAEGRWISRSLPNVPVLPGDESLDAYLRRIGFSDAMLDYTQRGFAGASAEAMRNLSARTSLEEMRDETAGSGDYRILDGYDRLLGALAVGLDIRLNTVVEAIDWSGDGVRVTSTNGKVFEGERVILTLPLGVLKARRVRFTPELPAEKQAAIDQLRVGPAIKLVYRFDAPVLPQGVMALYSALNPCMWWSPSYGHDDADGQVLTAFVTGDRARALLALGEAGALAQGVEVLRTELGQPTLEPSSALWVNWVDDPYSFGGYSATPPGARDAHAALAEPIASKLYWAGEAAAGPTWKASVHGAYFSGRRAAGEILSIPIQ
jgi:monoamine oxidase